MFAKLLTKKVPQQALSNLRNFSSQVELEHLEVPVNVATKFKEKKCR